MQQLQRRRPDELRRRLMRTVHLSGDAVQVMQQQSNRLGMITRRLFRGGRSLVTYPAAYCGMQRRVSSH